MTNDLNYSKLPEGTLEMTQVPLKLRRAVLMSQGIWNNVYYDKDEIKKAFSQTDWNGRERRNLFLDHKDYDASEWIGEVQDLFFKNDTLYGDLIVYDPIWAAKLKYGKPKVGISPKVKGDVDEKERIMSNFTFENFSLVINPAVKTAYINNMEALKMDEEAIDRVLIEEKEEVDSKEVEEMKDEDLEDILDLFEICELKNQNISKIVEKAKSLREESETLKSSIRRAIKMAEDEVPEVPAEEVAPEEAPPAEAPTEETPKEVPAEEATEGETPADGKEEKTEEKPMEAEEKLKEKIVEMEKKIKTLSEKLNEPERTTVKKAKELSYEDPDRGMIAFLKNLDEEGVQ